MNASQRQEFCVRWNSHLGSIGAAFPQLLAGQRFVDVTLACEGHQVHCHRLVLAACSSYFESLLSENPCKHPVIILPSEIKLWEIQALVDFMYKGEVNVTQAGLPQLLRCAEQLRIRGLYGSDAALNLNQLKALTNKAVVAAAATNTVTNESTETDDTTTNSTTTTNAAVAAAGALQQMQMSGVVLQDRIYKKERPLQHQEVQNQALQQTNGRNSSNNVMNMLQHNHTHRLQQFKQEIPSHVTNSNAGTEDESADDSTSNAYDQYEEYSREDQGNKTPATSHLHIDSTVEEDHNYVAAHDEDDSFGANADAEHEVLANLPALQTSTDMSASFKRVRRSEASLAQAAKCVSKGQTFQNVSNMFSIPVSTIRFYMARKGILPKRKRGRGASNNASGSGVSTTATLSSAVMSHALAEMKRSGSPVMPESRYHLVDSCKLGEQ